MPVKDPKEVFLLLLSHVREATERGAKFYDEVGDIAKDPEIKEALEARAFVSKSVLARDKSNGSRRFSWMRKLAKSRNRTSTLACFAGSRPTVAMR